MPSRAAKRPAEYIDLDFAVEIDGTQVKQLTIRRPNVRDMLGFEEGKGSNLAELSTCLHISARSALTPSSSWISPTS